MSAPGSSARRRRPILAAATLLLGGLGLLSLLNRSASLHVQDGIDWRDGGDGIAAVRVVPGGAGDRAGLRVGDLIRSIDGSPVESAVGLRDRLWGRGGIVTEYRVSRNGTESVLNVVPESSGEENRVFYYLWIVAGVGLGVSLLTAWNLPAGSGAGWLFLLATALYALLAFSPGGTGTRLDWFLYWGDLGGRLLTPPLLAQFLRVAGAGEGRGAGRRAGWLYLPGALLLLLAIYLIPLRGALRFADPAAVVALKDRAETLYLAAGSAAALVPLFLRFWGSTEARLRWRRKWLVGAGVLGLLPPVLLYLIPKALGIAPGPAGEVSVFLLALVPLGLAAALFQDRSIGLERSQQAVAGVLLAAALFLGIALALSYAGSLLAGGLPVTGPIAEVFLPILISGIATLAVYPRLSEAVGRLLSHRPPILPAALLDFRDDLNGELHLARLAGRFEAGLRRAFAMQPVALLVREGPEGTYRPAGAPPGPVPAPEMRLDRPSAARLAGRELILIESDDSLPPATRTSLLAEGYRYLFPLAVGGDVGAVLLMGGHRDGSPLPDDEAAALAALAAQAARGVEAARLYREIEARSVREEALRLRTQAVLESSRIGILLVDGGGRVSAANGAAAAILGQPKLLRRPLRRLLPPALQERLAAAAGDRAGRVYRFPLFTPGGTTRIVNVTRAPLASGTAGEQVYTLDDVGEEVRREEILERQGHLASMGLMASQVAHEVNTPLTGIASYAQILMSRLGVRPPEMDLLRRIESQAFRAADIAGSVLNYARRRDGEPPRRIDAGALVEECLGLFEAHIKGKRIRVRRERSPVLPEIVARPGRIQQMVLNLLLNAAAALPAGGEVWVEVDREEDALRIRISDDGVGIPPEIQARIFEPFFTSRPDGQGTGLGLWVVDQVVREHGGGIRVESTPGVGTRFTVRIPAAGGAEATMAHGA